MQKHGTHSGDSMAYLVTDVGGTKNKLVESALPIWLSWVFAPNRTIPKSHSSWGLYAYINVDS